MSIDLTSMQDGALVATLAPPASTPSDLQRYAQASGDGNPLHLDRAFAREAGFADLVVHGMLGMAYMARLITERFPQEALRSFGVRFKSVVLVGQSVRYEARLARREGDLCHLHLQAITDAGDIAIEGQAIIDAVR